jgi:hypothetical protein
MLLAALGLGTCFAWLLWLTRPTGTQSVFSSDTVIYADTARHIAAGQGITTGIIHLTDSPPSIPQVSWPPLYPLLVAKAVLLGVAFPDALMWIPIISAAFGVFALSHFLLRRFGWVSFALFGVLALTAKQILRAGSPALTEGIFLGLLAVATFLTIDLLVGAKKPWLAALLLGLIGGCMVALRYVSAGVPLSLLALLMFRKQVASAAITALGFAAVAIPLFLRNFVFLRQYTNERFTSDVSFVENLRQTITSLALDFWRQPFLLIAVVVALGLLLLRRRAIPNHVSAAWMAGGIAAAGLLGGTILSRTFVEFDVIYSRFVAPAEWLLIAPAAVTLASLLPRKVVPWVVAIAILSGIYGVRERVYDWNPDRTWTYGPKNEWIAQHTEPNAWVIGNQALEYNFFYERTVTPIRATTEPNDDTELAALIARLSLQNVPVYFVLADPFKPDQHTEPMVALKQGARVPSGLTPVPAVPSLTVYRINR